MDLRLVKNVTPGRAVRAAAALVRAQGYHLIGGDAPTDQERATYPLLAKLRRIGGYPAGRTPLTNPTAQQAVAAVAAATHTTPARMPTLGGSTPFYLFSDRPEDGHGRNAGGQLRRQPTRPNENLRLGNFFDAITMMRAIISMP